ncbi:MAG: hypothetical protein ACI8WM_002965 [Burkholderiaceae bacterium]|jgi:hypothetical protein
MEDSERFHKSLRDALRDKEIASQQRFRWLYEAIASSFRIPGRSCQSGRRSPDSEMHQRFR